MSLKKLFPLLALVIILVVGFGYVKPAVDSILAKLEEKRTKTEELETAARTRDNFGNLVSERNQLLSQTSGRMAMEYLPTDAEQERMADIVHQLSLRSGVVVDAVVIEESRRSHVASETNLVFDESSERMMPPSAPDLDSLTMDVDFRGTYKSIRGFLFGLSSTGRLHEVIAFSIEEGGTDEEGAPSDMLAGSVTAKFFTMSEQMYSNAHLLPVFEVGVFDADPLEKLGASSEQLPVLPVQSGEGRVNPFVL